MPHQPRFDWQLWFSALSPDISREFYLVHFLYKILQNDPTATQFLVKNYPFKEGVAEAPVAVKVDLFHYWFTEGKEGEGYWRREF